MSTKGKVGARIRRAVAVVVHPWATEIRNEIAAMRAELRDTREALLTEIKASETRHRRGIFYAADVRAAAETERFVAAHLIRARPLSSPRATLEHALDLVSVEGMALEFGVASGTTLRVIVEGLPGREIFGFDVFTGLPEDWRPRFAQGTFAQQAIPEVPGATLVEGLFEDTLPSFLEDHSADVAFIHLDADLYSSTKTVLDLLGDRLVPGTIVLFDEYFNYHGWEDGEYRAWEEFATKNEIRYEYLAFSRNDEQVVLAITGRGFEG